MQKHLKKLDTLINSSLYKDTIAKYQELLDQRIQYYEQQSALLTPMADKLSALELGTESAVKNALLSDYLEKYEYLKNTQMVLNYQKLVDMFSDKPYVNSEGGINQLQRQALLNHISELDDKEQAKLVQDLLNEHPSDFAKSMQKLMDAKATGNLDDLTNEQLATYKLWMAQSTQQDYINALKAVLDPHSSDFAKLMDKLTSSTGEINLDDFTPEQRTVLENWQKISAMQDYINALNSAIDPHSGDFAKLMDKLTQGNGTVDFDNLSEADRTALEDFTNNLADQRIKEILNPRSSDFAKNMQDLMTAKATGNLDDLTAEQLATYKAWMAQDATQSYIDALKSALDPHSSNFANLWDKLMVAKSTGDLDNLTETERGVYGAWQSKTLTQDYIDALNKALDPHSSDFAKTIDSLMDRASVNKQIVNDIDTEIKNPETLRNDLTTNPDKIESIIKRANDTMDNAPDAEIQAKLAEFRTAITKAANQENAAATVDEIVRRLQAELYGQKLEATNTAETADSYLRLQQRMANIDNLTESDVNQLKQDIEAYDNNLKAIYNNNLLDNQKLLAQLKNYLSNPESYENNLEIQQAKINQIIEQINNNLLKNPSNLTSEELELWQSINADIQSLTSSSAEQAANLVSRIQESMNKLLDLSKTVEKSFTAEQLTTVINNKLKDLGYSDENISQLTDSQKFNIVANNKTYESLNFQILAKTNELRTQIAQDQQILDGYKTSGQVDDNLIKTLQDKIQENQSKLSDLENLMPDEKSVTEISQTERQQLINSTLKKMGYSDNDIAQLTDTEKLDIISGNKTPTKVSFNVESEEEQPPSTGGDKKPTPEPEQGGNVVTKIKTEVKTETVVKTPEELEEMMADKEKEEEIAPEKQPEPKPTPKPEPSRSPSTKTEIQVSQPEGEPYWTWVWENGAVVFKQVTPQKLQQLTMTPELNSERALEIQRENDAAQQLAQRLGISVTKALEMIQNGVQQLIVPSQVQQMNKVQTMEQVMAKEPQPQPQPEQIPAPNLVKSPDMVKIQQPDVVKIPQPDVVKIPQPDVNKIPQPDTNKPPATDTKIIPPPVIWFPKRKEIIPTGKETSPNVPAGSWVWVQGIPNGGAMWKVLPPPYKEEDLYTIRHAPVGAYKFPDNLGKGLAYRTFQIIGKPAVDEATANLGWTTVTVKHQKGNNYEIKFGQNSEANVGKREETIGMGQGQIPIEVADAAKAEGISPTELREKVKSGEDISKYTQTQEGIVKQDGIDNYQDYVQNVPASKRTHP